MPNPHYVMLIVALVLFVLAALPYPPTSPHYNRLVAAGLAFGTAAFLF